MKKRSSASAPVMNFKESHYTPQINPLYTTKWCNEFQWLIHLKLNISVTILAPNHSESTPRTLRDHSEYHLQIITRSLRNNSEQTQRTLTSLHWQSAPMSPDVVLLFLILKDMCAVGWSVFSSGGFIWEDAIWPAG